MTVQFFNPAASPASPQVQSGSQDALNAEMIQMLQSLLTALEQIMKMYSKSMNDQSSLAQGVSKAAQATNDDFQKKYQDYLDQLHASHPWWEEACSWLEKIGGVAAGFLFGGVAGGIAMLAVTALMESGAMDKMVGAIGGSAGLQFGLKCAIVIGLTAAAGGVGGLGSATENAGKEAIEESTAEAVSQGTSKAAFNGTIGTMAFAQTFTSENIASDGAILAGSSKEAAQWIALAANILVAIAALGKCGKVALSGDALQGTKGLVTAFKGFSLVNAGAQAGTAVADVQQGMISLNLADMEELIAKLQALLKALDGFQKVSGQEVDLTTTSYHAVAETAKQAVKQSEGWTSPLFATAQAIASNA